MAESMMERVSAAILPAFDHIPNKDYRRVIAGCWARAAIEAMRRPTDEMVAAANRNNHPRDIDTWRTMIDEALK